jgi:hypothetical protein
VAEGIGAAMAVQVVTLRASVASALWSDKGPEDTCRSSLLRQVQDTPLVRSTLLDPPHIERRNTRYADITCGVLRVPVALGSWA